MTTELSARLDRIEAVCREVLEEELRRKGVTEGPWIVDDGDFVRSGIPRVNANYDVAELCGPDLPSNAAFIARARTICPATAQATILQIGWLREDLQFERDTRDSSGIAKVEARMQSIDDNFPTDL